MREQYTPAEHAEAQDKLNQHEKGREEAKFYRLLLTNFRSKVVDQLTRKDALSGGPVNLDTTDLKLKQFQFCDANSLQGYIKTASSEAAHAVGSKGFNISFETNTLAEMTPLEFHEHIQSQIDSLIKEGD